MVASIQRVAPVLSVRDVRAALDRYRRLGFSAQAYGEEAAGGPIYGFVARDGVELHLARVPDLEPSKNTSACYLYVDDAAALYSAWRTADAGGDVHALIDRPYGLREFAYVDPDGNLLRVGSPLPR